MPLQFTAIYPEGEATEAAGGPGTEVPTVNEEWPGLPPGAEPIHRDLTLAAATTGTVIWQPGPNERAVVVSAFVSTDAAGRVAIVDDQDVQGKRIAVLRAAANGGASPNLVPAPYPTASPGTPVRVVSTVVGNVDVRVSGYTIPG
jgi:hypothetical protein